eukprot:UN13134
MKEGWMKKYGADGKSGLQKRFFKLTRRLEYYTDDKLSKKKGDIIIDDIENITITEKVEDSDDFNFVLSLQTTKCTWRLLCESEENREGWKTAIENRQAKIKRK